MNGKLTRISLAKAGDGRTDWKRLRSLRDSELDEAIASDPDCLLLTDHFVSHSEARVLRHVLRAYRSGRLKPWIWTRPLRRSELRKISI